MNTASPLPVKTTDNPSRRAAPFKEIVKIEQLKIGPMDNFSYLLWDETVKEAAVIDPAWEPEKIEAALSANGLALKLVLLTHAHPDHVNALGSLAKNRPALPVYLHEADFFMLEEKPLNLHKAQDGALLTACGLEIKVIHTPGHTPGSVCYLTPEAVFTGDTLFIGECGRVDLPGSSAEALYGSLRRLAGLAQETLMYPGHSYNGDASTMGAQKEYNDYLRLCMGDKAAFLRALL